MIGNSRKSYGRVVRIGLVLSKNRWWGMVDEQWMRVPPSITLLGLNLIRPDPWTGTIFCPQLATALKCLFFTFFFFLPSTQVASRFSRGGLTAERGRNKRPPKKIWSSGLPRWYGYRSDPPVHGYSLVTKTTLLFLLLLLRL